MNKLREVRHKLGGKRCVYCGEYADSLDHFPPKSYCLAGLLLPACLECNYLATDDYPTDFLERCRLVKERIARKYCSELATPEWSQEEINGLGYALRRKAIGWQRRRDIVQERLAWNAASYLTSIDRDSYFVRTYAEDGSSGIEGSVNWTSLGVDSANLEAKSNKLEMRSVNSLMRETATLPAIQSMNQPQKLGVIASQAVNPYSRGGVRRRKNTEVADLPLFAYANKG